MLEQALIQQIDAMHGGFTTEKVERPCAEQFMQAGWVWELTDKQKKAVRENLHLPVDQLAMQLETSMLLIEKYIKEIS